MNVLKFKGGSKKSHIKNTVPLKQKERATEKMWPKRKKWLIFKIIYEKLPFFNQRSGNI